MSNTGKIMRAQYNTALLSAYSIILEKMRQASPIALHCLINLVDAILLIWPSRSLQVMPRQILPLCHYVRSVLKNVAVDNQPLFVHVGPPIGTRQI